MSTGVVIGIVICAALLVALILILNRGIRGRRMETLREQGRELRQDAQSRELRATRRQAEADERSARAKQAEAEAEEKAAMARREEAAAQEHAQSADRDRRFARERHEQARSVDPDATDESERPTEAATGRRS